MNIKQREQQLRRLKKMVWIYAYLEDQLIIGKLKVVGEPEVLKIVCFHKP